MHRLASPKLRDPVLVAGWPGMGLVAFRAVSYMIDTLDPAPLADFDSPQLYPLKSVEISEGIIESTRLPQSRAYYHVAEGEGRDLVLFLGEEQPVAGNEWSLSSEILDLAVELGVSDVFTFAAMVTHVDHKVQPRIFGCATNPELAENLHHSDVNLMQEGQISGLNGLLLGIAKQRGMSGTCLLGELPYYLTQIAYPSASLAVIESFSSLVGIEIDLDELRALSAATLAEIDTYFEQLKDDMPAPGSTDEPFEELSGLDEDDSDEDEGMLN